MGRGKYPGVDNCVSFACWAIMLLTRIVMVGIQIMIAVPVWARSNGVDMYDEIEDRFDEIADIAARMTKGYNSVFGLDDSACDNYGISES